MNVYCAGKNCSKANSCRKHVGSIEPCEYHNRSSNELCEYHDYSMEGGGSIDSNGIPDVSYYCGNYGEYKLYEEIDNTAIACPNKNSNETSKILSTKIIQRKDDELPHDSFSLVQCANCHSHGIQITLDENDYLNLKCQWCGVTSTVKLKENSSIKKYTNMWNELRKYIDNLMKEYQYGDNYKSQEENVYGKNICKQILGVMDDIKDNYNKKVVK